MPRRAAIAAAALIAAACSRGGGREARARLEARDRAAQPAPFDWSSPSSALSMTAGEAARRLGSFDFTASVAWSATRAAPAPSAPAPAPAPAPTPPPPEPAPAAAPAAGAPAAAAAPPQAPPAYTPPPPEPLRVRAAERHRVRQLAGGDFHAVSEIDPAQGEGAVAGGEWYFVGGKTWARGRFAPLRERPGDRGREARRFRDESFRLAGDLAALLGPSLVVAPTGQGSVLGRPARRFDLSLARSPAPAPAPADAAAARSAGPADEDTRRRLDFLDGRVPLALEGEMLLDAETGVPLLVKMKGAFGERGDPRLRLDVALEARIGGWGSMVEAIAPPQGALGDDRKPRGVAQALEQAGLRKRGEEQPREPQDEGGEGE